jgi:hypothetical protein
MLRYVWCVALVAAGCAAGGPADDSPADPLTGTAQPVELDLAASSETPARIGVSKWAVEVTHNQTVVRGLDASGAPLGEVVIVRTPLPDRQSRLDLTVRLDHETRLVADSDGTVRENSMAGDLRAKAWLDEVSHLQSEGVTGKSFREASCGKSAIIAAASCAGAAGACWPPVATISAGLLCGSGVTLCGVTGYDALNDCGLLSPAEQNQRPEAPQQQQNDPQQNPVADNNNGQDPADGVQGDDQNDPVQMASDEGDGQQDPGADDGNGYDNFDPGADDPGQDGFDDGGAADPGQDGFDEGGADDPGADDGNGYDNFDPGADDPGADDPGADPGDGGFDPGDGGFDPSAQGDNGDPGADDGGYDPGADDGGYDPGADDGGDPCADGSCDDGSYDDGGYDDGGYADDGSYDV